MHSDDLALQSGIVIMNKVPDRPNVVTQLFRERERLAN